MTTTIIIIFCVLLLIAYLFDLTSSKTRIPSVIMLLLTGWIVRQVADFLQLELPNLDTVLPIFGTIGLILIVLEGALELEINRSKIGLITKSSIGALLPMVALSAVLAYLFYFFSDASLKDCITNAIPFCVISSAIAIPSVRDLSAGDRDFVIYESSFSEILGVLFFNFMALNAVIDAESFANFGWQILIVTIDSFVATMLLSFLLSKIDHHIKFVPIILLVILIYAVSKVYHLPALVFILMFGLFIGNIDGFRRFKWVERFKPGEFKKEVHRFGELVGEAAFLIKALFFLLFGYLIDTAALFDLQTLIWSVIIVALIFLFRFFQIKLSGLPIRPLFYIAPRGLITILLFLSIVPDQRVPLVNKPLIIQVILITTIIMMVGLMATHKHRKKMADGALMLGEDLPHPLPDEE